jgi:rubrerythrin
MGFLNRLFGTTPSPGPPAGTAGLVDANDAAVAPQPTSSLEALNFRSTVHPGLGIHTGDETLYVVGESYRQDTLWAIVGGWRSDPVREDIVAELVPEPENTHDPNAIKVLIGGELVGYLSREDAAVYLPGLQALINTSASGRVWLDGVIVGGGPREDGPGRLGVFLNHDPVAFGVEEHDAEFATLADLPAGYGFRTGLSSAQATDLEDDSYDLSWLEGLSRNVATAIQQLRTLLGTVADPIDRHYMMAELEERLYGCRAAFSSALDDYDAVCRQHDAEMDGIRAALFAKFGRLPILDTYRQAAVRCQKAGDWPAVLRWAERGLTVYGDDAAKPEVVEDLRKRATHAKAKIEAASHPKPPRRPRAVATPTTEVETLVCAVCGTTFERLRTPGRKPHACPTCRGTPEPAS